MTIGEAMIKVEDLLRKDKSFEKVLKRIGKNWSMGGGKNTVFPLPDPHLPHLLPRLGDRFLCNEGCVRAAAAGRGQIKTSGRLDTFRTNVPLYNTTFQDVFEISIQLNNLVKRLTLGK